MTPEPTPGRAKQLHTLRLAAVRWLLGLGRPATLAELCRGLGDNPDVPHAVFDHLGARRIHPWFEGNRHALAVSWSGWEAVSVDPLASARRAVAGCRNVATVAEALAHARAYREAPADEPIRVRVAE